MRQSATSELTELLKTLPAEIGTALLDLVVENMDIPNADEIVKRIRAITGAKDPDIDENSEEAIEQAKQESAQAQLQAKLAELTMQAQQADVAKKTADAKLQEAKAERERMNTQKTALDGGEQAVALQPAAVHTADHLLKEAGFKSDSELQEAANAAAQQQPPNPNQPQELI